MFSFYLISIPICSPSIVESLNAVEGELMHSAANDLLVFTLIR